MTAEIGARHQLKPLVVIDGGIGRTAVPALRRSSRATLTSFGRSMTRRPRATMTLIGRGLVQGRGNETVLSCGSALRRAAACTTRLTTRRHTTGRFANEFPASMRCSTVSTTVTPSSTKLYGDIPAAQRARSAAVHVHHRRCCAILPVFRSMKEQ